MHSHRCVTAITFDLDGTLIDSAEIKTQAFGQLFQKYGSEIQQVIIADHRASEGTSRFAKFERWYRDFLCLDYSFEIGQALSQEYNRILSDQIVLAPWLPGAVEFLEEWHARIPLYLASATPHVELQHLMQARSMNTYFRRAWGYPTDKTTALKTVAEAVSCEPLQILMVGDAESDYFASKNAGTLFCHFVSSGSSWQEMYNISASIINISSLPRLFCLHTSE